MKLHIIKKIFSVILLFSVFMSCSSVKSPRPARIKVPVAIIINTDNSSAFGNVGLEYYRLKVMDILDDNQDFDAVFVEADENPEIIVNISIDNFIVWPKDERVSRQTYTRSIQTGTTAGGQPTYQTVSASADFVQTQIRSSARFASKISFRGTPPKTYQQTFNPTSVWQNNFVRNIQGDSRAIDAAIYSGMREQMDPLGNDFLLALSEKEMLGRLSYEIRLYYQKPRK